MEKQTHPLTAFFGGCKQGMHLFGQNIALIVNTLLLLVVYLIGVGLTSIIARIAGKRFLDMKLKKGNHDSYWKGLDLKGEKLDDYYRQF